MDAGEAADPAAAPQPEPQPDALTAASAAFAEAVRVAEAALALLRAELRLARSSALALVWLAFALVFLGVGAWLATSAAIAAGVYELTGNLFYGIGSVALANLFGIALVLFAMRGCWRDLSMPRTRRVLGELTDRRHESV
jgi:hypothetical protein